MSTSNSVEMTTSVQRTVTPHHATREKNKRERSNNHDDEPTRRVLQKTEETPPAPKQTFISIKKLIKEDLKSADVNTLLVAIKQLSLVFRSETAASEARCQTIQEEFLLLGGPTAIITIMDLYPYWRDFQYYSLGILQRASFKNKTIKAAIGNAGGMQAILQAMTMFWDVKFQYNGLKALLNLCSLESNAILFVKDLFGVAIVLERMSRFSANEQVVLRCCLLLHNLSLHESLRHALFTSGAVVALYSAALRHENHQQIRQHARTAVNLIM